MRGLKPINESPATIYNGDKIKEFQQEIDSLENRVEAVENDISALENKDTYDVASVTSDVINADVGIIGTLSSSSATVTGNVNAGSLVATTGTIGTVNSTNVNSTNVTAENINVEHLTIEDTLTADIDNENTTSNVLEAGNATLGNATITSLSSPSINSSNVNTAELTTPLGNVTDLTVTNAHANQIVSAKENVEDFAADAADIVSAKVNIEQNRFKAHDLYYIDIPEPAGGNTDFKIIKLSPFVNGTYRLTYKGNDGVILFSVIFTQAFDNISFKYTKNAEWELRNAFEKVAIFNDNIYIQTFHGGRLYYQCDSLNVENQPSTYDDWPIDLEDENCYVYEAVRVYGDVYTHYVIAENMGGAGVLKPLSISNIDNIENVYPSIGGEPANYDTQEEVAVNIYVPDQTLNTDSEVTFDKVTSEDITTTGSVLHKADVISLRNTKETAVTDVAGISVKNYDGNNSDKVFGIDSDGDLKVGALKVSPTGQISNTKIPYMNETKWGNTNVSYDAENARLDGLITKALGDEDGNNIKDTYARQDGYIPREWLGAASTETVTGVATLNENGLIPIEQMPTEAVLFKGMWNASTNTPHLVDGTGTNGDYYIVSVGGVVTFSEGNTVTFNAGDGVIYDGAKWNRKADTNVVQSVNGHIGVVELDKSDIGLDNVDNLSAANYFTDLSKEENGDVTTISATIGGTTKTVTIDNHHDDIFTDLSEPNDNEVSMTIGGTTKSLDNIAMTDKNNTFTGENSFPSIKINGFVFTIV